MVPLLHTLAIRLAARCGLIAPSPATEPTTPPPWTLGVDVSRWQGEVNWRELAGAGVRFGLVKATEGKTHTDKLAVRNLQAARDAGILVGAYHYSYIRGDGSTRDPRGQARHFLDTMGPHLKAGDLYALDLEGATTLEPAELVAWVREFVAVTKRELGCVPLLYTMRSFWQSKLAKSPALNYLPLWQADYDPVRGRHGQSLVDGKPAPGTKPEAMGWPEVAIWQYSGWGSLPGVAGTIDLNVTASMERLADLAIPVQRGGSA